jgi:hypothetical protein
MNYLDRVQMINPPDIFYFRGQECEALYRDAMLWRAHLEQKSRESPAPHVANGTNECSGRED